MIKADLALILMAYFGWFLIYLLLIFPELPLELFYWNLVGNEAIANKSELSKYNNINSKSNYYARDWRNWLQKK